MIPFYTDYPFSELGDEPGKLAPIRQVAILGYDGDKYATVAPIFTDLQKSIKAGYIYATPRRFEDIDERGRQEEQAILQPVLAKAHKQPVTDHKPIMHPRLKMKRIV